MIKYLASNHGEEITDSDENNLKVVQCIGGGATNGLTDEGILIIAGKSTVIAKMNYNADILIALPNDYIQKDAKLLMELEEKNLWKFKKTGEKYSEKIAYDLLHKALPGMANSSIKELADVVFDYRFNMGSNENCSFVYDGLMQISDNIRNLYEENKCDFLALSSVGPAFFAIVKDDAQKKQCKHYMEKFGLKVMETSICNSKYIIRKVEKSQNFWQKAETVKSFSEKTVSKYVTDVIDSLDIRNKNCIDIGCGGGRYSKYLIEKDANVLAIDKNPEMFNENDKINFISAINYLPPNRPLMVLLSKEQINKYLEQAGFKINKKIDEHITNVGSGQRNVYTILIQK